MSTGKIQKVLGLCPYLQQVMFTQGFEFDYQTGSSLHQSAVWKSRQNSLLLKELQDLHISSEVIVSKLSFVMAKSAVRCTALHI
jgi:hypothetical protein